MSKACECGEEAERVVTLEIRCEKCSWVKKIPITLKATVITALLAYGGSQFIDYAVTDNRYPLKVEYAIMKSCVNSYPRQISGSQYKSKEDLCLCALEDTMNEISHVRYKVDEKGFLKAFGGNVKDCGE